MFLKSVQMKNREWLVIAIDHPNNERLKGTCFRGHQVQRAGNLLIVGNIRALIGMSEVQASFVTKSELALQDASYEEEIDHSFTIDLKEVVGWSSTASLEGWCEDQLEAFKPNKRSSGLRVLRTSERRAPLTNLITFVCTFKYDGGNQRWIAIIRSIYPGKDIGQLKGNITEREKVVFFDWNHPGEPLPT